MNDIERSAAILLACLLDIRGAATGESTRLRYGKGICSNVDDLWDEKTGYDCRDLYVMKMDELFTSWPEYSGCESFPVPAPPGELDVYQAYYSIGNKWVGEYGAARVRLLDYMIEQLEAEATPEQMVLTAKSVF